MEEKVVYKRGWRDNYLSLKNLVRGRVYLTVEDQVIMYLGVAKSGKHLFYHLSQLSHQSRSGEHSLKVKYRGLRAIIISSHLRIMKHR